MPSGRRNRLVVLALAAALLAAASVALLARRGAEAPAPPPPPPGTARTRPTEAYRPKAEPLRRAPRPALPAAVPKVPEAADDGDWTEDGIGLEAAVPPPVLRDDDPALAALEPERTFSESVWSSMSLPPEDLIAEGARHLASDDPDARAFGGVLLFFGGVLEDEVLGAVASDPNPLVPLTVFDWVRDFGTDEQAAAFREAFATRGMAADELLAFAEGSAGLPGGGRSALDLFLAGFAEDDVPVAALARLVASPGASYDVREQALFKLLEPATRPAGEAALQAFADGLSPADGALAPFVAGKLADLAEVFNPDGDDEKVWDAESPVVFFLSQDAGGLQARDLANYLEYALRRDDAEFPPVIEEGTWEFANEFLLSAKERIGDFPPVELDALDRIAASLDRLIEYDPAFNPFETEEDDGLDEDEESDDDEGDDDE